jgi:hypothetical protein
MIPETSEVFLEFLKFGLGLLLLAAGWFIGQRIIAGWDLRKKQQELDIASAVQFQQLYGELKAVGRTWREYRRRRARWSPPKDVEWQLLALAIAAESKYEAVVIKLSAERHLTQEQRLMLGHFRQACQQARQSIRDNEGIVWSGFGHEYRLFNDLAAEVTCLIAQARPKGSISPETARGSLEAIATVRTKDWQRKVAEYKSRYGDDASERDSNDGDETVNTGP